MRVFGFTNRKGVKEWIVAPNLKQARSYYQYLFGLEELENCIISELIV
jgi:hypothetical protein